MLVSPPLTPYMSESAPVALSLALSADLEGNPMTRAQLDRRRLIRARYIVTIQRDGDVVYRRLTVGARACRLALRDAARHCSGYDQLGFAARADGVPAVGVCPVEDLQAITYQIETRYTPPGGYVLAASLF